MFFSFTELFLLSSTSDGSILFPSWAFPFICVIVRHTPLYHQHVSQQSPLCLTNAFLKIFSSSSALFVIVISYNLCFPRHTNLWKKWNYITIISRTVSDFHPHLYLGHLLQSMGSRRVRHNWATSLSWIGEGNGNPLQCSCLENPRDSGAWWAADCGVTQSRTRLKRLSSSSGGSSSSSSSSYSQSLIQVPSGSSWMIRRCLWASHVSSQPCLPRSSPTLAPIRGTCCQSRCFPWRGLLVPDHRPSCRGNPPWGYCLLKLPTIKVSPALKAGSHCYRAMRPLLLPQPSGLLIECYSWGRGSF